MQLKIRHTTTFTYDQPISEAYTEMRLKPLDADGQRCVDFRLTTEPQDVVLRYTDPFGNDVRHFDVIQPHQKLMVAAVSDVLTPDTYASDSAALSPLDEFNYLSPSDYAPHTDSLAEFSNQDKAADPMEIVLTLMHTIYKNSRL